MRTLTLAILTLMFTAGDAAANVPSEVPPVAETTTSDVTAEGTPVVIDDEAVIVEAAVKDDSSESRQTRKKTKRARRRNNQSGKRTQTRKQERGCGYGRSRSPSQPRW